MAKTIKRKPAGRPPALKRPASGATTAAPLKPTKRSTKSPAVPIQNGNATKGKGKPVVKQRPAGNVGGVLSLVTGRVQTTAKLKKMIAQGSQRALKFQDRYQSQAAVQGDLSLLEKIIILPSTEVDYQLRVQVFEQWRLQEKLPPALTAGDTFLQVLDFLDVMFMHGTDQSDGSKLVAGLQYLIPQMRAKSTESERTDQTLKGWANRAPTATRLPPGEEAVFAVIGQLVAEKYPMTALWSLLTYLTGRRPGETSALRVKHMLPPVKKGLPWGVAIRPAADQTPVPSKTGTFDESVLLDDPEFCPKLNWVWEGLVKDRDPEEFLIDINDEIKFGPFKFVISRLGMEQTGMVLYSLRHAAASVALANKSRTLGEVKLRGGWRSERSMKRYTRPALINQFNRLVPKETLEFGSQVKINIDKFLRMEEPPS